MCVVKCAIRSVVARLRELALQDRSAYVACVYSLTVSCNELSDCCTHSHNIRIKSFHNIPNLATGSHNCIQLIHSFTHSLTHSLTHSDLHYRLSPARPHQWLQTLIKCHTMFSKQNTAAPYIGMIASTAFAVKVHSWIEALTVCNLLPTDSFARIGVLGTGWKIILGLQHW